MPDRVAEAREGCSSMVILVVDDAEVVRPVLTEMLEGSAFSITEAEPVARRRTR